MIWTEFIELMRNEGKELWLILWLAVWTLWDLRYQKICCWQGILVLVTGLIWRGIDGQLFTATVPAGMALGLAAWSFSLATEDRFGRGDAMVIWCLGLYLGFGTGLAVLMWGLLIASAVSLYLLWCRKKTKDQSIPFIPCLAAGLLIQQGLEWISR